jgi:hypothetical protein
MTKKVLLGLALVALTLMVALLMASPPETEAQGLIEYAICGDKGVGIEELGLDEDEGLYLSCTPRFTSDGEGNREFTRVRFCAIVYKDLDESGGLSRLDRRLQKQCQRVEVP